MTRAARAHVLHAVALASASLAPVPHSWGQDEEAPGRPAIWSTAEGLPAGEIRDFAQTPDGAIWVATTAGIARWQDGNITTLKLPDALSRARQVVSLTVDEKGGLWMAPSSGDPVCWLEGRASECLPEGHRITKDVRIVDLQTDKAGRIWLATDDLVYLFADGQLSWLASFPEAEIGAVRALHAGTDGRLWIAGARGLFYRASEGDVRRFPIPGEPAPDMVALASGTGGTLWAVGKRVIVHVQGDSGRITRHEDGLPHGEIVRPLQQSGTDTLWLATANGLLRRSGAGAWQVLTSATHGLPSDDLTALFEDREGSLWVGTRQGSIARLALRPAESEQPAAARSRWLIYGGFAIALALLTLMLRTWWRRRTGGAATRPPR